MASQELDRLRSQIDQMNLQILELLNERGRLVQEVGKL
ncbi:chorismate mutase, partial [Bacillus cereus]